MSQLPANCWARRSLASARRSASRRSASSRAWAASCARRWAGVSRAAASAASRSTWALAAASRASAAHAASAWGCGKGGQQAGATATSCRCCLGLLLAPSPSAHATHSHPALALHLRRGLLSSLGARRGRQLSAAARLVLPRGHRLEGVVLRHRGLELGDLVLQCALVLEAARRRVPRARHGAGGRALPYARTPWGAQARCKQRLDVHCRPGGWEGSVGRWLRTGWGGLER